MPYGLHMRLDVPERQACDLRASQGVQGNATIAALVGMSLTDGAAKWMSSRYLSSFITRVNVL